MRDGTAASLNASKADDVIPFNAVALNFDAASIYVNTTPYTITFGGNDYLGVGDLGAISKVQEGKDIQARGVNLDLSGIPPELVSIALNEQYQGRPLQVWLGFLDSSHTLIIDPVLLGKWKMDTMDMSVGKTATISVKAESRLSNWNRPRSKRYTNEEQQENYPTDKGLEFVAEMIERQFFWGKGSI